MSSRGLNASMTAPWEQWRPEARPICPASQLTATAVTAASASRIGAGRTMEAKHPNGQTPKKS